MSDYTATGKPLTASRGVAADMRNEFSAIETAVNSKADLASPALTGVPTAPTATTGTATTQIATTDFVAQTALVTTLPGQAGNGGKYLTTDGASASWGSIDGRTTVASHATTADIWGVTGNEIDFTGTETVSDFAAAAEAGQWRTLHIAAACSFTHGGDISVQGGQNITCQAGDIVTVHAITTTTFRVALQSVTVAPRKVFVFSSEANTLDPMGLIPHPFAVNMQSTGATGPVCLAYGSGLWIAKSSTSADTSIYSSPDGVTWTARAITSGNGPVGSNGTEFFWVDPGTTQGARSSDGITWAAETLPTTAFSHQRNRPAGLSTGEWCIQGAGGTYLYSTNNGNTWTTQTNGGNDGECFYTVNDDTFWVFKTGSTGMTSTTGATGSWTDRTLPFAPAADQIWQAADGTIVIADGLSNMAWSTDGINWTEASMPMSMNATGDQPMYGMNGVWHWPSIDFTDNAAQWFINDKIYQVAPSLETGVGTGGAWYSATDGAGNLMIPCGDGFVSLINSSNFTAIFG